MKPHKEKIIPVVWLVFIALTVEIFICNFSFWKSLCYGEKVTFSNIEIEGGDRIEEGSDKYIVSDGVLTIHIPEVNTAIHNLFFSLEFSGASVVPYIITLTDEGNFYPYTLPENQIVSGISKSYYTDLHTFGKVVELTLQFTFSPESVVDIKGISANMHMPFAFHIERFLVVLGAVFLPYLLKRYSANMTGKRQAVLTAVAILFLIGLMWKVVHVNPICINSPWPHHKQYQELAEVMSRGQFYLDATASDGLLNAENPYDTIYLQANNIDYKADYSYYEGKYYVYFGVVPELLFYLPCYMLTGHQFPNYMAVYLCYCGFILAAFALYREIIRRWFPQTPFSLYLLISIMTVCCGNYLAVAIRPDLYHTPIMAATMFTVGGLWLWIKGKYAEGNRKRVCFFLGSACMALVAGCRPQMLLFSFLAVALFREEVIKRRELFSRRALWDTVCICLPYVVVAVGIMYYNAARFGSPFDFGATYSLTSNDMTKRSFNVAQTVLGIWYYFLQPPLIGSDFPFLQANQLESSYMGKLNSEYIYGGILACNVFTWVVVFIKKGKTVLEQKGIYAFVLMNIFISLIIGIVDVNGAGILQRYMADMIWGLWFAAALMMLYLVEWKKNNRYYHMLLNGLVIIFFLQSAYGLGIVFGNGDLSVNVRTSNPELYYKIKSLLMF